MEAYAEESGQQSYFCMASLYSRVIICTLEELFTLNKAARTDEADTTQSTRILQIPLMLKPSANGGEGVIAVAPC